MKLFNIYGIKKTVYGVDIEKYFLLKNLTNEQARTFAAIILIAVDGGNLQPIVEEIEELLRS